jgi:cbb3-type cytochrome oxidase maturation protein
MNILAILIPASVLLGLLGLVGFFWLLRHDQFDDPEGHANRILSDRYDDEPADDVRR